MQDVRLAKRQNVPRSKSGEIAQVEPLDKREALAQAEWRIFG